MKTIIASVLMAVTMTAIPILEAQNEPAEEWENLGECRITCYCPICNDGTGYESSSGVTLEYGCAACNWLPVGTVIDIEGEQFTIVDTCGTDAIDIFIDTDECNCNLNEYRHVARKVMKDDK